MDKKEAIVFEGVQLSSPKISKHLKENYLIDYVMIFDKDYNDLADTIETIFSDISKENGYLAETEDSDQYIFNCHFKNIDACRPFLDSLFEKYTLRREIDIYPPSVKEEIVTKQAIIRDAHNLLNETIHKGLS